MVMERVWSPTVTARHRCPLDQKTVPPLDTVERCTVCNTYWVSREAPYTWDGRNQWKRLRFYHRTAWKGAEL